MPISSQGSGGPIANYTNAYLNSRTVWNGVGHRGEDTVIRRRPSQFPLSQRERVGVRENRELAAGPCIPDCPVSRELRKSLLWERGIYEGQQQLRKCPGLKPVILLRRCYPERHGAWRSLVAHPAGGRKVLGSNPSAPTTLFIVLIYATGQQSTQRGPAQAACRRTSSARNRIVDHCRIPFTLAVHHGSGCHAEQARRR